MPWLACPVGELMLRQIARFCVHTWINFLRLQVWLVLNLRPLLPGRLAARWSHYLDRMLAGIERRMRT